MSKHIALITGSTGGIGESICRYLAGQGWDLILLNRSQQKALNQIDNLKEKFPKQDFHCYTVDLSDLDDLKSVLREVLSTFEQLDAVFNVAGFLSDSRIMSKQNIESHFAINTVAPFLIAETLKEKLSDSANENSPTFIVNFSSEAINGVKKLDPESLSNPTKIGGLMGAYANSKLAVNVLSQKYALSLRNQNVLVLCVDPGPTKSPMTDSGDGMPWFLKLLRPFIFKSADQQTSKMFNCIEEALEHKQTGLFISNGKTKSEHQLAMDPKLQDGLYDYLSNLTGLLA